MGYRTFLRSFAKEFKDIQTKNTIGKDTNGQVVVELLNDDLTQWAFYITAHDGQFAGIQHDFALTISGDEDGYSRSLKCHTKTCHPNINGGYVCITMDDEARKSLYGYANMLLWLMINPDYNYPYAYASRIIDPEVIRCFNQAQTDRYVKGKLVPIIFVDGQLMNDHYRKKGANFRLENFRVMPVVPVAIPTTMVIAQPA